MGINSKNLPILQLLRAYINDTPVEGYEFCTVPKEGVVLNRDLSAMLRGDISNVAPEDFAAFLYRRNLGLKGALNVTRCKKFTEHDKKKGQSMRGWRLFELSGDDEFLNSLANFEESHQFRIGGSTVMIRGGDRLASGRGGGGIGGGGGLGAGGGSGAGTGGGSSGSNSGGNGNSGSNSNSNSNNPGGGGAGSGGGGGAGTGDGGNNSNNNVFGNLRDILKKKGEEDEEKKKRRRESSKESEEKRGPEAKGAKTTDG